MLSKPLYFIALAFLLGFAQASHAEKADPAQTMDKMAKELGLNDEQKSQVQAVFDEEKQSVEAIFQEQEERLKNVQEQTRSGLQQILTPEQMAKLDKRMAEREKKKGRKKR